MTTEHSNMIANVLEPDSRGRVTMQWSIPALTAFIDLLNRRRIRDDNGYVMTFAVRQFEPGEAVLEVTLTDPEASE